MLTGAFAIKEAKKKLRREMRDKRVSLGEQKRNELSAIIQNNLMASPCWQNATNVALYAAKSDEADTWNLIETAWNAGKKVILPKITDKKLGFMHFVACSGSDGLRTGVFGLLEPLYYAGKTPVEILSPDLFVLPGLAFDKSGCRLGQGGGFYDRFLASHKNWNCPRVALGFSFQLVESIPTDKYDSSINAFCSEDGLLWI